MRASHMGVESLRMWKKIFIHKREEYINLYKSESMVVSLASSNSSAEWAFNLPSLMPFSDRCLFMNHDTLQALMSINIIEKLWTPKERERERGTYWLCCPNVYLKTKNKKDCQTSSKTPTNRTRCHHQELFWQFRQQHWLELCRYRKWLRNKQS